MLSPPMALLQDVMRGTGIACISRFPIGSSILPPPSGRRRTSDEPASGFRFGLGLQGEQPYRSIMPTDGRAPLSEIGPGLQRLTSRLQVSATLGKAV